MSAQMALGLPFLWLPALAQRSDRTRHEDHLAKIAATVVRRIGRPLLKAANADEVDEKIEALLEGDLVPKMRAEFARALRDSRIDLPMGRAERLPFDRDVMGPGIGESVERAQRCMWQISTEQRRMLQRVAMALPEVLMSEPVQQPVGKLLRSLSVPAEVLRRIWALEVAWICSLAVADVAMHKVKAKPSVAKAIVGRWVESAQLGLGLLASMPGSEVPLSLVPRAERLDVDAEEDAYSRFRVGLSSAAQRARETDAAVFPPPPPES